MKTDFLECVIGIFGFIVALACFGALLGVMPIMTAIFLAVWFVISLLAFIAVQTAYSVFKSFWELTFKRK